MRLLTLMRSSILSTRDTSVVIIGGEVIPGIPKSEGRFAFPAASTAISAQAFLKQPSQYSNLINVIEEADFRFARLDRCTVPETARPSVFDLFIEIRESVRNSSVANCVDLTLRQFTGLNDPAVTAVQARILLGR